MLDKEKKGTLGKTTIWGMIEKYLFRPRVLLMRSSNRDKVNALNELAGKTDLSGINPAILKSVTGPTRVFAISAGEIIEEDYQKPTAMRLRVAFKESGIDHVDISKDPQGWLVFAASSLVANATLGTRGEALTDEVGPPYGGIRVAHHQAREIFKNGRGRQFGIYRERMELPSSGKTV